MWIDAATDILFNLYLVCELCTVTDDLLCSYFRYAYKHVQASRVCNSYRYGIRSCQRTSGLRNVLR